MSSVYEPREDSQFLAGFVRLFAKGRVLDMGTGTGVQAFAAIENSHVKEVLCVDINPNAVAYVKKRIAQTQLGDPRVRRIQVTHGDMFTHVEGKFDTIICNPPYLPDEQGDHDPALYGGPSGFEWSAKFLYEAQDYLAKGGQILFLFSSLTNRERIDLELKMHGYAHEELGQLAEFFERLYVYRIWRKND